MITEVDEKKKYILNHDPDNIGEKRRFLREDVIIIRTTVVVDNVL